MKGNGLVRSHPRDRLFVIVFGLVLISAHTLGGEPAARVNLTLPVIFAAVGRPAQAQTPPTAHDSLPVQNISYGDAKPVLEALRTDLLPEELRSKAPAELESAWPGWVASRDRAIRARLERGDEDSIVNFLLFGTTFTKVPRPTALDLAGLAERPSTLPSLFSDRIEDLIDGISSPGANERLQFARLVVERNGIDPETAAGNDELRRYLTEGLLRVPTEMMAYSRALRAASLRSDPNAELIKRTMFRDRGLSSDTSIGDAQNRTKTAHGVRCTASPPNTEAECPLCRRDTDENRVLGKDDFVVIQALALA